MKYPQDSAQSKAKNTTLGNENVNPKLKALAGIIPEIKLEEEKEAIRTAITAKISK